MKHLATFFSILLSFQVVGQDIEREVSKLTTYIQALDNFSRNIPQEKVYLHFDNTSYYQGDHIWFKCYVVTPGLNQLSPWSKTLYVELLNPGGEIVDKRILKVQNGQCHGEFTLNHLPFYSGFYEIRAYTKYMLNFGDDVIFSRLLPVFNKPKTESNFEEKNMLGFSRYGPLGSYSMKRERPIKGNRVNLRFFPEGGNLILGVESRVAFEATDEAGNQLTIDSGQLTIGGKEIPITTQHEGRGVFTYTPGVGRRRDIAEVEYSGRKYRFDLPACLPQGVVMEVDNLTYPDSLTITLRKNDNTQTEMLGVVILSGGKLQNYCVVRIEDREVRFSMDKTRLPAGVSQVVLFDGQGEIVCDRLIFSGKNEMLDIRAKTGKSMYRPYELVDLDISVTDRAENPAYTTFSLSVRDGANEVENNHSILTELLLMSEIKGYVRNPSYYFEENDEDMRFMALDVLLMVQGWRRYSWKQMAGVETFELKHIPEQGIETKGQIVSSVRKRPQPAMDVFLTLYELGKDDEQGSAAVASFVTDSLGRFSFVSGVSGKWNMMLSVSEKGKQRSHLILLDRVNNPKLKRYSYAELQVNIAENNNENVSDDEMNDYLEDDLDFLLKTFADSLAKLGIEEKIQHLPEVTVKAKRNTKEQDIYHNRSTSVAYYDIASELDDIYDRGKYLGNNIHELLKNMDSNFFTIWGRDREYIRYKNKQPLFVINYEPVDLTRFLWYEQYRNISLNAIKSIYINETTSAKCQYAFHPQIPCMYLDDIFGCVVFIETHPDKEIPVEGAKGVRKTWLEGYSQVKEFYNPDYSVLPLESDYRRTLYWNPNVTPDESGKAKIMFYNNSRCKNFNISAETVTPLGMIGIYRSEK